MKAKVKCMRGKPSTERECVLLFSQQKSIGAVIVIVSQNNYIARGGEMQHNFMLHRQRRRFMGAQYQQCCYQREEDLNNGKFKGTHRGGRIGAFRHRHWITNPKLL